MYCVMDIEAIKTRVHHCTRKLYILHQNGVDDFLSEYEPCISFEEFKKSSDFGSFKYCFYNVHKLSFCAFNGVQCTQAARDVYLFIKKHNIDFVFFKGGDLELDICQEINIPSFNLEKVGCKKVAKGHPRAHDPMYEVREHWKFVKSREQEIIRTVNRTLNI